MVKENTDIGVPISRAEALKISREILNKAEKEREEVSMMAPEEKAINWRSSIVNSCSSCKHFKTKTDYHVIRYYCTYLDYTEWYMTCDRYESKKEER